MTITARTILATVESIPETPENFRAVREAIHDLRAMVEAEAGK